MSYFNNITLSVTKASLRKNKSVTLSTKKRRKNKVSKRKVDTLRKIKSEKKLQLEKVPNFIETNQAKQIEIVDVIVVQQEKEPPSTVLQSEKDFSCSEDEQRKLQVQVDSSSTFLKKESQNEELISLPSLKKVTYYKGLKPTFKHSLSKALEGQDLLKLRPKTKKISEHSKWDKAILSQPTLQENKAYIIVPSREISLHEVHSLKYLKIQSYGLTAVIGLQILLKEQKLIFAWPKQKALKKVLSLSRGGGQRITIRGKAMATLKKVGLVGKTLFFKTKNIVFHKRKTKKNSFVDTSFVAYHEVETMPTLVIEKKESSFLSKAKKISKICFLTYFYYLVAFSIFISLLNLLLYLTHPLSFFNKFIFVATNSKLKTPFNDPGIHEMLKKKLIGISHYCTLEEGATTLINSKNWIYKLWFYTIFTPLNFVYKFINLNNLKVILDNGVETFSFLLTIFCNTIYGILYTIYWALDQVGDIYWRLGEDIIGEILGGSLIGFCQQFTKIWVEKDAGIVGYIETLINGSVLTLCTFFIFIGYSSLRLLNFVLEFSSLIVRIPCSFINNTIVYIISSFLYKITYDKVWFNNFGKWAPSMDLLGAGCELKDILYVLFHCRGDYYNLFSLLSNGNEFRCVSRLRSTIFSNPDFLKCLTPNKKLKINFYFFKVLFKHLLQIAKNK